MREGPDASCLMHMWDIKALMALGLLPRSTTDDATLKMVFQSSAEKLSDEVTYKASKCFMSFLYAFCYTNFVL